ncbi:MAG TPA: TetR/AcrR family transcriptional regulator C-terminal domain-containing protein [Nocardioidaceae bacterium]|nr:TetR/AcrR family transcriptional regulator C-terminal domain-containing protein [Nocardioidaceae bacterium]
MANRGRTSTGQRTTYRAGLSRDRVSRAAVDLADERGIQALTMRNLAQELGVEAMSLYHHVADKNEVLDGMVDVLVSEISDRVTGSDASSDGADPGWKAAVRDRILTAREVLLDHPWAPGVIASRSAMSPIVMRHYDSLMGLFRAGGVSVSLVHHAMHALGSRALGFTQELYAPQNDQDDPGMDVAAIMRGELAKSYPYITEIAVIESGNHDKDSTLGWCDDQVEFEFGLDVLLDGLERLHNASTPQR